MKKINIYGKLGVLATWREDFFKRCHGLGSGVVLLVLLVSVCRVEKVSDSEMDECNPYKGFFRDGEHYVERDSVNEDGTKNKYFMFTRSKKEERPCNPLNR